MKYSLYSRKNIIVGAPFALAAVMLAFALSVGNVGSSSAREITSGGGGGGGTTAACSPISSLTVKGDARVGELGVASVDMTYSVKPCDKTQTVRVEASISNFSTKEVLLQDDNAPLSGKYTYFGASRTLYTGRVTVYDAATGAVLGTQSMTVSTTPKGV